jgi:hypothetical protein
VVFRAVFFLLLQARGLKKHLKRLNAPRHWMLDKLGGAFVSAPFDLILVMFMSCFGALLADNGSSPVRGSLSFSVFLYLRASI